MHFHLILFQRSTQFSAILVNSALSFFFLSHRFLSGFFQRFDFFFQTTAVGHGFIYDWLQLFQLCWKHGNMMMDIEINLGPNFIFLFYIWHIFKPF